MRVRGFPVPDEIQVLTLAGGQVIGSARFKISVVARRELTEVSGDNTLQGYQENVTAADSDIYVLAALGRDLERWVLLHELDHAWTEWKDWLWESLRGKSK